MPRSRNPHSYPSIFWDLLDGMKAQLPEIRLTLPANKAWKLRHDTYGFIYSLEAQARVLRSQGDITTAARWTNDANTMRGYLISVEMQDGSPFKKGEHAPAYLLYIHKDLSPEAIDIKKQLEKQLEGVTLPQPISDEPEAPSINFDEFFNEGNKDGSESA